MDNSGLKKKAKVGDIIENGQWNWPVTNSRDLMKVKDNIGFNPLGGKDWVKWSPNPNGNFSIRLAWEEFCTRKDK